MLNQVRNLFNSLWNTTNNATNSNIEKTSNNRYFSHSSAKQSQPVTQNQQNSVFFNQVSDVPKNRVIKQLNSIFSSRKNHLSNNHNELRSNLLKLNSARNEIGGRFLNIQNQKKLREEIRKILNQMHMIENGNQNVTYISDNQINNLADNFIEYLKFAKANKDTVYNETINGFSQQEKKILTNRGFNF